MSMATKRTPCESRLRAARVASSSSAGDDRDGSRATVAGQIHAMVGTREAQIRTDEFATGEQHARFAALDLRNVALQQAIPRCVVAGQRVENDVEIRVVGAHAKHIASETRCGRLGYPVAAAEHFLFQPAWVAACERLRMMSGEIAERDRVLRVIHQQCARARNEAMFVDRGEQLHPVEKRRARTEPDRPDQIEVVEENICDANAARVEAHVVVIGARHAPAGGLPRIAASVRDCRCAVRRACWSESRCSASWTRKRGASSTW